MILTEGDIIIQDIIASPDDDNLRLIYADWLEEDGQAGRAEFIRLGVHNHGEQPHNTFGPVGSREEELLVAHASRWLAGTLSLFGVKGPIGGEWGYGGVKDGVRWTWRRGFVHTIRLPLAAWLKHGEALRAAHPLERVEATCRRPARRDRGSGERWGWRWTTDVAWPRQEYSGTFPWYLPTSVWGLFGEDDKKDWFPTEQAAVDALSEALLAWAKEAKIFEKGASA